MSDAFRCIIKDVKSSHYIGMDYSGKKYKIIRNEYIRDCKVGDDFYFYAIREKGFFKDTLTPVSDEMAGVVEKKLLNKGNNALKL